jgi:hypothetical protein
MLPASNPLADSSARDDKSAEVLVRRKFPGCSTPGRPAATAISSSACGLHPEKALAGRPVRVFLERSLHFAPLREGFSGAFYIQMSQNYIGRQLETRSGPLQYIYFRNFYIEMPLPEDSVTHGPIVLSRLYIELRARELSRRGFVSIS